MATVRREVYIDRTYDIGRIENAHIPLGEKVHSASIIGNSAEESALRIMNRSKGDVRIVGNTGLR